MLSFRCASHSHTVGGSETSITRLGFARCILSFQTFLQPFLYSAAGAAGLCPCFSGTFRSSRFSTTPAAITTALVMKIT